MTNSYLQCSVMTGKLQMHSQICCQQCREKGALDKSLQSSLLLSQYPTDVHACLTNYIVMSHKHPDEYRTSYVCSYVCGIYEQKAPITDTQTELGWDTLEQRRLKSVVTMGYKIVNNLVAVPSTQLKPNTRGTRGNGKKFHQIYAGTNYYKFSFFPMLVPLWNTLPSNVVLAVDLEGFKDALTKVHVKSIYPN